MRVTAAAARSPLPPLGRVTGGRRRAARGWVVGVGVCGPGSWEGFVSLVPPVAAVASGATGGGRGRELGAGGKKCGFSASRSTGCVRRERWGKGSMWTKESDRFREFCFILPLPIEYLND